MLAAFAGAASWSVVDIVIATIVIVAVIAILYIALNQFGVQIPQFVVRIFWIIVVAVIAILAIKFLVSLW
jgi:hypothetical protein